MIEERSELAHHHLNIKLARDYIYSSQLANNHHYHLQIKPRSITIHGNMNAIKQVALGAYIVTVICLTIGSSVSAQKTIANSYQQELIGSGQNSVYGGYNSAPSSLFRQQQRQQTFVSPVKNQRRTQSSSFSRQTNFIRPQQPNYEQQQIVSSSSYDASSQQAEADAEPASYGSVNGQPGIDFPNYTRVPKTSFSCENVPYPYGMYADEETGCQAYHLCYNGRKDSFLCGPGTVFNQRILHCDYWYSVDCAKSSQYYSSNAYMGSSQPEPGPAQASGSSSSFSSSSVQTQTAY